MSEVEPELIKNPYLILSESVDEDLEFSYFNRGAILENKVTLIYGYEEKEKIKFLNKFAGNPLVKNFRNSLYTEIRNELNDEKNKGKIFLFANFGRNNHPYVNQYILDLFYEEEHNPHECILLGYTHDVTLIDIAPPSHIWFMDTKEDDVFYCLDCFEEVENNKHIRKSQQYLGGRFGAVPHSNDIEQGIYG
jgi:hypothetical protein